MFQNPALRLLVGIGLCSLGGAMLYVYFKNKDEEEEKILKGSISNQEIIKERILVLNKVVPILIGRSEANIKIIEDKTGTEIRFIEKNDEEYFCEISGLKSSVLKAKEMINKEIQKSPTITEEIIVPQSLYSKMTGKYSKALHDICKKSLAKVSIGCDERSQGNLDRSFVISGNREQVKIAKQLIEEKIKEDEEYQKSIEELEQKREPRRTSPTNSMTSSLSNHSSMTSVNSTHIPSLEKLTVSNGDSSEGSLEVYVSAVASPSKFWLQLIGPQSRKLDELNENMYEYYNNEENRKLHKIADPYLGQIVAALFKYDNKWYRAQIVSILPNEYYPRNVVLDLYFVDYGDSEYVQPNEVYELRTDFLTLRFQAIECFLANIKPLTSNQVWDQQSISRFEELTHAVNWKKLAARVVTHKDRPKKIHDKNREGSQIPGVELFDSLEGTEINIGQILISEGFALPDQGSDINNEIQVEAGDFKNLNNSPSHLNSSSSSPSPSKSNLTDNSKTTNFHHTNLFKNERDESLTVNNNENKLLLNGAQNSKNFIENESERIGNTNSTIIVKNNLKQSMMQS